MEGELRLMLGQLETFAAKVSAGLHNADFSTRRDIICALVKRVEVDEQQIRVAFHVSPTRSPSSSGDASHNWQHWGRRVHTRTLDRQGNRLLCALHYWQYTPFSSSEMSPCDMVLSFRNRVSRSS